MFYLLKNCKKREILRVILGGFWKLCFDPQKGATNKNRRITQAYGRLPLSDPPWACLLFYQIKISEGEQNYEKL